MRARHTTHAEGARAAAVAQVLSSALATMLALLSSALALRVPAPRMVSSWYDSGVRLSGAAVAEALWDAAAPMDDAS